MLISKVGFHDRLQLHSGQRSLQYDRQEQGGSGLFYLCAEYNFQEDSIGSAGPGQWLYAQLLQ
ncbi:hypothetical protein [Nitrosomonas aestuarii]|uniref:hypothetical protein n=1 Tax=Nitrosomonas aestuarii TaxID=52441 RepID=UPI0011B2140B|nr:hypothetical protein [Nitrosomonas aestuarii]